VRWRGAGLESLGPATFRIAVRVCGRHTKVFGLNLLPASQ
jgi:hypothetical protein